MPKRQYIRDAFGQFADTTGSSTTAFHHPKEASKRRPEGKETAATVAKRIADPAQPIQPAGPKPKTYTASTYPGGMRAFFEHVRSGPTPEEERAWDEYDRSLRNDPTQHKLIAQILNGERSTRRDERRQWLGD